MTTVTLQIGNSDDKLTQAEWHRFVEAVRGLLESWPGVAVHFFGAPPNWTPWQNAAWVFAIDDEAVAALREAVVEVRARFRQESVAWTEGAAEFV